MISLIFVDFCEEDLGLESGELGDEALTASSSYDPANVGPKNARFEENGNANENDLRMIMRAVEMMRKRCNNSWSFNFFLLNWRSQMFA